MKLAQRVNHLKGCTSDGVYGLALPDLVEKGVEGDGGFLFGGDVDVGRRHLACQ